MTTFLACLPPTLLMASAAIAAMPVKTVRTLATDAQIAAWRGDAGMHRLMLQGDAAPFCAAVGHRPAATWVEKQDEWLWRLLLPTTIGRAFCVGEDHFSPQKLGCPVHGSSIYTVNAFYPWIVDCENLPGKITCPIGGETYPSNDFLAGDLTSGEYPDDGNGCVRDGKRYHFIRLYAHYAYNTGVVPAVRSLSRAYSLTGDRRFAHKAAVLLLRVATEYPNSTDRKDRTLHPGYGEFSGMITDGVWEAGVLEAFAYAYDEVFEVMRDDAELLAFAQAQVPAIRSADDLQVTIEDQLFRPGIQALLDARVRPNVGWGQGCMATLALLLNDTSAKHPNSADAMEWLYYSADGKLAQIGNQFYKDGSSYESTGYNDAREAFLRVGERVARLKALAPGTYDERRYPDILANEKLQQYANYKAVVQSAVGRHTIAVGDAGSAAAVPFATPSAARRPPRQSEFLDGYGLAILRDRADETNATLFYGGVRGHAHYDPLFIGLYAYGRDLLPNIGYPQSWGGAAAWEWALITHQTVAVDRDEKPCSTVIGSLDLLDRAGRIQVQEASKRPYRRHEPRGESGPDVRDYRRLTALVPLPGPGADAYLLDVFRVSGGRDHLQSWRGPYTPEPVVVEGPTTLTAQPTGTLAGPTVAYGTRYKDASGRERWDPYCHLKNVATGAMPDVTAVTWTPKTQEPVHLRLNFVPQTATELIRADGGAPIAPDKNVLQWAFQHRQGDEGLTSAFVTVVEPYLAERRLRAIRRLEVQGTDPSGYPPVALEVTYADGRDLLLAAGAPDADLRGDGFRLIGRFGLIRERGGKLELLHLTAGTLLQYGTQELRLPPAPVPARVIAVRRGHRELTVAGDLGVAAAELPGRRLCIDNHGERRSSYTITAAAALADGQAKLVLESSGELGQGLASGFEDGVVLNGKTISMPLAGLVRLPDGRLDYSDCLHNGGHLENGRPGVSFKVRGVMGFPYQAWGKLHDAGINHVHLAERVPAADLQAALADAPEFRIYEYGVGDAVWLDQAAEWAAPPP